MGRWAQRTRRGGGPSYRPPDTITITSVTINDFAGGELRFVFSAPVTAAAFSPGTVTVVENGMFGELVQQDGVDNLIYSAIGWQNDIFVGNTWTFGDVVPNVETPQTGAIT
jgi:hypothetical protein